MTPPVQARRTSLGLRRAVRIGLLALGMASLVCGIWGGLIRLPLILPLPSTAANWITFHGPLMVCGFLGTVISLERAVGLGKVWTYAAPAFTGSGALLLVGGVLGKLPILLIGLGSAAFLVVTLRIFQLQRALFTAVMAGAAATWVGGNVFWFSGFPIHQVVPWWIGFLALTIVGERLDLSRFQKPSPWSKPSLAVALGIFLGGVILSSAQPAAGERLAGVGMLALGLWLGRFDIARKTVRQAGLSRFMALCLLIGYAWLALAGALLAAFAPVESGLHYDAALHSFFLGFVFSMIFGHAPVIFPAVLQVQPCFHRRFYLHVGLLHLGLVLRVGADLGSWAPGHQWGGVLTAAAVALFLINTVLGFALPRPQTRRAAQKA